MQKQKQKQTEFILFNNLAWRKTNKNVQLPETFVNTASGRQFNEDWQPCKNIYKTFSPKDSLSQHTDGQ